jgi:hypothetical protein
MSVTRKSATLKTGKKSVMKPSPVGVRKQVQRETEALISQRIKDENKKCSTKDDSEGSYGDNSSIQMDLTGNLMLNSTLNSWCQQLHAVDIRDEIEFDAENADDGKFSHEKSPQLTDVSFSHELSYTSHLTSMNAIPSYIHLHKTKNKTSSQRTQLGSIAHVVETKTMTKSQGRNHNKKFNKKQKYIKKTFINVEVPREIMKNALMIKEIQEKYIVIDGGDNNNPAIKRPKNLTKEWKSIRVLDEKLLHAVKSNSHEKGLMHRSENGSFDFMLLPRNDAMNILPKQGLSGLTAAISSCEKAKGTALLRGRSKMTFGDDIQRPPKYTSVGVQPNRAKPGVSPIVPFMKKIPTEHLDWITKMMRWSEFAFEKMVDHSALHHIRAARDAIAFRTMCPSSSDKKQTPTKYYGAIAFGRNVHLRCHTDQDYLYSVIQVHLEGRDSYSIDEKVVAYFCFPTLGIAVALCPGDFLLFNPTIPHCISSRCRNKDNVISVSSYLKTAVVGMNDNSIKLSDNQKKLHNEYTILLGNSHGASHSSLARKTT